MQIRTPAGRRAMRTVAHTPGRHGVGQSPQRPDCRPYRRPLVRAL